MNTHTPIDPRPPGGSGSAGGDGAVAVVSLYQKHKKIYARAVSGTFANWRWVFVWLTQALFYGLPWLQWNGRQAVLFELVSRRFYVFDLVLYPQDLIYLSALLMISAYSLFLFTAVAGRLWCGYACPQTVYAEIFMWFETKIEGDRVRRIRLDEGPWNLDKVWRKTTKQLVWTVFALATGFTFVGYFTPIRTLAAELSTLGFGPWEWFWVLFYGAATYLNAGFMREQVCKYICPYARFQSAMFDKDTLIIGYDAARGEPRGARSRKATGPTGLGSCVDCKLCVQVCPTGIDIRDGLQYECIGCAACVDACDSIMDKMNYPRGLVRYATQGGLTGRRQVLGRILRPRVLVYTAILVLICGVFAASVAMRHPFRVDVVRDRASLARIVEDGMVENVYRLQIMNNQEREQTYRVRVDGLPRIAVAEPRDVTVGPAEARWISLGVRIPFDVSEQAGPGAHVIHFQIERVGTGTDAAIETLNEKSTFLIPR